MYFNTGLLTTGFKATSTIARLNGLDVNLSLLIQRRLLKQSLRASDIGNSLALSKASEHNSTSVCWETFRQSRLHASKG